METTPNTPRPKLQLDDVRKKLAFSITKGTAMYYLKDLERGHYNTIIDYDVFLPTKGKNLQRPLCWTLFQKQQLILSVLKEIKLPPISYIHYSDDVTQGKSKTTTFKIIDGKQRLSTLISFLRGEFPIEFNGADYFYSDLEEKAQGSISFLNLDSDRVYEYPDTLLSDDDKIAWFEMINFSGTAQDIEHLNNLKA